MTKMKLTAPEVPGDNYITSASLRRKLRIPASVNRSIQGASCSLNQLQIWPAQAQAYTSKAYSHTHRGTHHSEKGPNGPEQTAQSSTRLMTGTSLSPSPPYLQLLCRRGLPDREVYRRSLCALSIALCGISNDCTRKERSGMNMDWRGRGGGRLNGRLCLIT